MTSVTRPLIRPGTLQDVRALVRMHERCSQLSITRRYLSPLPVLSTRLAGRLLCPPGGFSLVTERADTLAGITTVAPYADADPWSDLSTEEVGTPRRADVGQLVTDTFQRQGIGTALLLAAAREAGRCGFTELAMAVQPDNPAVLPMVYAAGLRARVGTRDGLTQVSISLDGGRPSGGIRDGRPPVLHSPGSSAKNGLALSS